MPRTLDLDQYHALTKDERVTLDAWLVRAFPLDGYDRLSAPTPYRDFLPIRVLTEHDDGTVTASVVTNEVRDDEIVTRTVTASIPGPLPIGVPA